MPWETPEAVVVGAGWAGLGVSHALAAQGIPHRVLERGRIGEPWLAQRWDSFHMNTANVQTVMPGRLAFAGDPAENVRFGDEGSAAMKRHVDAYIAREGIVAPPAEPDPAETVAPRLPDPPMGALDPAAVGLAAVVWCTGFRGDFRWIRISGVLDAAGEPGRRGGVSPAVGLCFAGIDFASTRRSGTILAIAEEAPRLAARVAAQLRR